MTRKIIPIAIFLVIIAAVLFALFILGGDPKNTETAQMETPDAAMEATPTPIQQPQQQYTPEPSNTIEPDSTSEKNDKFVMPPDGVRPYAVMIDNGGEGPLPQGGLDMAQVIYEVIVEGGLTRLMPVYWGITPELVGPVRSSRHYFLDYSMEHDAIYVHFGWSPKAQTEISKFKINNINGILNSGGIFFDLTKDKKNWQDSYTTGQQIIEYSNKSKYKHSTETKVFTYSDTEVELTDGLDARTVQIKYSYSYNCGFEYDDQLKVYKRLRVGKPHIERTTGEQLTAVNIIIQNVKNYTIKGDDKGRQEVDTVGSGSGWFITGGKAVKLKWSKESRSAPTKYTDEKGNPITLNVGQAWIQIVPLTGKITIQ